ncbi:hypothetical protein RsTz2092_03720 [Deferribacterales bacterium RsTz2092]|nr:hypothetical protein AGMMS49941_02480 [Deferribacterales bacterium]
MSGSTNIIERPLYGRYKLKDVFIELSHSPDVASSELIRLREVIVDVNTDAWLNVLLSSVNSSHTRFPLLSEVIAASADYFTLRAYSEQATTLEYSLASIDRAIIDKQLAEMPKQILDALQPQIEGGKLRVNVHLALLSFERTI